MNVFATVKSQTTQVATRALRDELTQKTNIYGLYEQGQFYDKRRVTICEPKQHSQSTETAIRSRTYPTYSASAVYVERF